MHEWKLPLLYAANVSQRDKWSFEALAWLDSSEIPFDSCARVEDEETSWSNMWAGNEIGIGERQETQKE